MKPGTPLPWLRNKYGKPYAKHEHDTVRLVTFAMAMSGDMDEARQNDQYVLHACNAYPKLVEALRQAMLSADLIAERVANPTPLNILRNEAESLLRELGETA